MKSIEQVGWDHEEVMRELRAWYAAKMAEQRRSRANGDLKEDSRPSSILWRYSKDVDQRRR
tara:strand:+ start:765 stop:947 length:183 start_codon:yes stop_codon:yes gene_type:complete